MIDDEERKPRAKTYTLKVISQALIDLGWASGMQVEFYLEQALNEVHRNRGIGIWRKRAVKWGDIIFESQRAAADYLRISEQSVHYYLKTQKEIQKHKIELL